MKIQSLLASVAIFAAMGSALAAGGAHDLKGTYVVSGDERCVSSNVGFDGNLIALAPSYYLSTTNISGIADFGAGTMSLNNTTILTRNMAMLSSVATSEVSANFTLQAVPGSRDQFTISVPDGSWNGVVTAGYQAGMAFSVAGVAPLQGITLREGRSLTASTVSPQVEVQTLNTTLYQICARNLRFDRPSE